MTEWTNAAEHLRVSSLVHDLQEKGLVLVSNLVLSVSQPIYEARQNWDPQFSYLMTHIILTFMTIYTQNVKLKKVATEVNIFVKH